MATVIKIEVTGLFSPLAQGLEWFAVITFVNVDHLNKILEYKIKQFFWNTEILSF